MEDMIEKRIVASFADIRRIMNIGMYGDEVPFVPPTRWQRVKRYAAVRRDRVRDAWLVLTGQVDLDDYR